MTAACCRNKHIALVALVSVALALAVSVALDSMHETVPTLEGIVLLYKILTVLYCTIL